METRAVDTTEVSKQENIRPERTLWAWFRQFDVGKDKRGAGHRYCVRGRGYVHNRQESLAHLGLRIRLGAHLLPSVRSHSRSSRRVLVCHIGQRRVGVREGHGSEFGALSLSSGFSELSRPTKKGVMGEGTEVLLLWSLSSSKRLCCFAEHQRSMPAAPGLVGIRPANKPNNLLLCSLAPAPSRSKAGAGSPGESGTLPTSSGTRSLRP